MKFYAKNVTLNLIKKCNSRNLSGTKDWSWWGSSEPEKHMIFCKICFETEVYYDQQ